MTHILYRHARNVSLLGAVAHWVRHVLRFTTNDPHVAETRGTWRSRVLVCVGWAIVLVTQAALILLVKELVVLCHGVIDLYLELAGIQLDLTSQYISATNPPSQ